MLNEAHRAESHCLKCDTCDAYPCLVHAKADAEVIAVRPALKHSNITLLTNAEVVQLKTSPSK
jgi:choline dehydrogenase-like flavoprotein